MLGDLLRRIGFALLIIIGAVINLGFLAGFVYETVWLIQVLGWWGVVLQSGLLVFALVVVWELLGDFVVDKWENWRYRDLYPGELRVAAHAARELFHACAWVVRGARRSGILGAPDSRLASRQPQTRTAS